MTVLSQRQGATRRQLTAVSSAARDYPTAIGRYFVSGNPPANGSPWSAARGNPPANDSPWSAARGNPPANDSPWSATRGNSPAIGSCLVRGKGQPAGNWQVFSQRQGAIRRQLAVVSSAARGKSPTKDTGFSSPVRNA
jgi:hypothetical protein